MLRHEVQAFFEAYAQAFNRLDGEAVAAMWHAGGSGIAHQRAGQAALTWWAEPAPMRANHLALCEVYRSSGLARTSFELLDHVPMGPDHGFARLRWQLWRTDGGLLQTFGTGYQLMRTADGLRVLLCTAFEEDLSALRAQAAGPVAASGRAPRDG